MGYDVASEDMQFATEICMETKILEIDLTDFLKLVCSHMNHSVPSHIDNGDQVFADLATPTTAKSVTFDMPGSTDECPPVADAEQSKTLKRSR